MPVKLSALACAPCRIWSSHYVLIVSIRAAQPTVPTSSRMSRALQSWLAASNAATAAMDTDEAPPAPVATLSERQDKAGLLCRRLWERSAEGDCEVSASQVSMLVTVALRAGVPGLLQDVLQHIVMAHKWLPFDEEMAVSTAGLIVAAWDTIGIEAKSMLTRVIMRCPINCALRSAPFGLCI